MEQLTTFIDRFILKLAEGLVIGWKPGFSIFFCFWISLKALAHLFRHKVILIQFDKNRISITSLNSGRRDEFKPEVSIKDLKKREGKEWKIPKRFSDLQTINPFSHPRCLFIDTELAGNTLALYVAKHLGKPYFYLRPPIILSPVGHEQEDFATYELSEILKLGKLAGGRNPTIYFGKDLNRNDEINSTSDKMWYPRKPRWI